MATDLELVQERIQTLERSVARGRGCMRLVALVGLCTMAVGVSQRPPEKADKTIRAGGFVLTDDDGKERAILGFRDGRIGLFILPRKPSKEIPELVFVGVERPVRDMEYAWVRLRSEITPAVSATMSSNVILLRDEHQDSGISLNYSKSPSLEFNDRSGFPYVSLSYDEKGGVRFRIRSPLGVKDAFGEATKAYLDGTQPDPRIEEALNRSLRIDCGAPPFSDPYVKLWKDGQLLWNAK